MRAFKGTVQYFWSGVVWDTCAQSVSKKNQYPFTIFRIFYSFSLPPDSRLFWCIYSAVVPLYITTPTHACCLSFLLRTVILSLNGLNIALFFHGNKFHQIFLEKLNLHQILSIDTKILNKLNKDQVPILELWRAKDVRRNLCQSLKERKKYWEGG